MTIEPWSGVVAVLDRRAPDGRMLASTGVVKHRGLPLVVTARSEAGPEMIFPIGSALTLQIRGKLVHATGAVRVDVLREFCPKLLEAFAEGQPVYAGITVDPNSQGERQADALTLTHWAVAAVHFNLLPPMWPETVITLDALAEIAALDTESEASS